MRESRNPSPIESQQVETGLRKHKSVEMPPQVSTFTRAVPEILETEAFLPEWMYFQDDHFHKNELDINVDAEIRRLEGLKGLKATIGRWIVQRAFSDFDINAIPYFFPHVADSGTKGLVFRYDEQPVKRRMGIVWCRGVDRLYKRLAEPESTPWPKSD